MNKIELVLDIILNIGLVELLSTYYKLNKNKNNNDIQKMSKKERYFYLRKKKQEQNNKSLKIFNLLKSGIPFIIGMVLLGLNKYYIKTKFLNKNTIIKILFLTSINDTLQELFGKFYGKTKVTSISPNKTLEGYLGGYLSMLFLNLVLLKKRFSIINILYFGNIIGDLFFSYIKRLVKIKDYSKILGSHGGILDRFDSFIIPSFIIGLFKLGV